MRIGCMHAIAHRKRRISCATGSTYPMRSTVEPSQSGRRIRFRTANIQGIQLNFGKILELKFLRLIVRHCHLIHFGVSSLGTDFLPKPRHWHCDLSRTLLRAMTGRRHEIAPAPSLAMCCKRQHNGLNCDAAHISPCMKSNIRYKSETLTSNNGPAQVFIHVLA